MKIPGDANNVELGLNRLAELLFQTEDLEGFKLLAQPVDTGQGAPEIKNPLPRLQPGLA